jgi:hypothetical protein
MRMEDVKVGMRLRPTLPGAPGPVTVTELTPRGFKYRLDAEAPLIPRRGMRLAADGHEHFGLDGQAMFEPERQCSRDGPGTGGGSSSSA